MIRRLIALGAILLLAPALGGCVGVPVYPTYAVNTAIPGTGSNTPAEPTPSNGVPPPAGYVAPGYVAPAYAAPAYAYGYGPYAYDYAYGPAFVGGGGIFIGGRCCGGGWRGGWGGGYRGGWGGGYRR